MSILSKRVHASAHDPAASLNLSLNLRARPIPATRPAEDRGLARDEVKLLVLHRNSGETRHDIFVNIAEYLQAGDLVVVNSSKTLPASLPAAFGGKRLRIHLASRITDSTYIVERRSKTGAPEEAPFHVGDQIQIDDASAIVIGRFHPNSQLWYIECKKDLWKLAMRIGQPIRYGYLESSPDAQAFQTIFAKHVGSAEMPSAARPFTDRVVAALTRRGVLMADITLHTGVSSHEVAGSLDHHPFLPEWYRVPAATAALVNRVRAAGGRVIAVGTTVVRAMGAATNPKTGEVAAASGWTDIVITPGNPVPSISGLITGLHESDTSHLAMLFSFVDPQMLNAAYQSAVDHGYLWHEFGDINLILP